MNIKSPKFILIAIATFIILFLMNFIGNQAPDKLQSALMIAFAGVIGLTIGMWFVYRNRGDGDNSPHDFD